MQNLTMMQNYFQQKWNSTVNLYLKIIIIFLLEEDTQDEINMKYRILDIYNLRLSERERRKKFVIDRDMLNLNRI